MILLLGILLVLFLIYCRYVTYQLIEKHFQLIRNEQLTIKSGKKLA